MALLVVIVNYRTADLTIDCLRTLVPDLPALGDSRVVVVDNASGDDSARQIGYAVEAMASRDRITVLQSENNGGFASGNNAAIRPSLDQPNRPRLVLLLNPDTLVRPGAVKALVQFMDDHLDVGIAGSRLEDPDGTPQRSAFRFPSVLGEVEGGLRLGAASRLLARWTVAPPLPEGPSRVDWVAGASMIIRSEVFDSIGLLDESYFMYFEEVDFCRRAALAGWPCWHVPESRIVHLVGQSSGVTDRVETRKRRPSYWFSARRRYFRTHLGAARTFLADVGWASSFALYRLRRAVLREPDLDPHRLLSDFLRHNFGMAKK